MQYKESKGRKKGFSITIKSSYVRMYLDEILIVQTLHAVI